MFTSAGNSDFSLNFCRIIQHQQPNLAAEQHDAYEATVPTCRRVRQVGFCPKVSMKFSCIITENKEHMEHLNYQVMVCMKEHSPHSWQSVAPLWHHDLLEIGSMATAGTVCRDGQSWPLVHILSHRALRYALRWWGKQPNSYGANFKSAQGSRAAGCQVQFEKHAGEASPVIVWQVILFLISKVMTSAS